MSSYRISSSHTSEAAADYPALIGGKHGTFREMKAIIARYEKKKGIVKHSWHGVKKAAVVKEALPAPA